MKVALKLLFLFLFAGILFSSFAQTDDYLSPILKKKEITLVITDSGLGGLAVMDDVAKKLSGAGYYKKVNLIFVNALFDADRGYNTLQSRQEKIDIFSSVLQGIEKKFHPDIILIACNTLSVIYKETSFVKESDTPVVGIVDAGVKMIGDQLSLNDNSAVIITGTETTISEDSHRKALLDQGFSDNRIITKACPELQSYIEQNPEGEDTEMLISIYTQEALSEIPSKISSVYLSLNCSHFGYSEKLWKQAFNDSDVKLEKILNPNTIMGDVLLCDENRNRFKRTKLTESVYSKVLIKNKDSISKLFQSESPELARALNNYILEKELF